MSLPQSVHSRSVSLESMHDLDDAIQRLACDASASPTHAAARSRVHRLAHDGVFRMRRLHDGSFEFRRPGGRVIPRCAYRLDDTAPDPAVLEDCEHPSAEAWLAALIAGRCRDSRRSVAAARQSVAPRGPPM